MHFHRRTVELITVLLAFSCTPLTSPLSSRNPLDHLPGFNGTLPSRMETGYVTVDEARGTEFFYYFVKSEREPREDPVILWLTGGPGCSSFFGFSQENGPVEFMVFPSDPSFPSLIYNPYAWTKISNIIFLDWPSESGFSYSKRNAGIKYDDSSSANQIYYFIQQWFVDHPQFLRNPFYVGGDSYGGKMAILVAHHIMKGNEAAEDLINLEGLLVGNTRTGVNKFDINSRVPRAHGLGIISDELFESIESLCVGEDYLHPVNAQCQAKLKVFNGFIDEIWIDNMLKPICSYEKALKQLQEPMDPDVLCTALIYRHLSYLWANDNLTRRMLGVKEGTVEEWLVCNYTLKGNYSEDIPSILPHLYDLLSHGHRALVYSGDHDLTFSFIGTIEWIESFNLTTIDYWRSWHLDDQVVGYTESYTSNLTFATVLGAGHEAIQDRPMQCWAMFERWITHMPL